MTKLLILDLNGLLVSKQNKPIKNCCYAEHKCGKYYVYLRPQVFEFIEQILNLYDVAIFSSTTFKNAMPIVELLFKEQQSKLKFKWFRDRTEYDPDTDDHSTIKELVRVWRNPTANWERTYNKHNTLICDDDLSKVRFNSENNYLVVAKFDPKTENDLVLEDLVAQIEDKFSVMQD